MSYAVKGVSTERGLDRCRVHDDRLWRRRTAARLGDRTAKIGMRRVIIPLAPGHFCAFGMLHADLRYDLVKTWFRRLADVSL